MTNKNKVISKIIKSNEKNEGNAKNEVITWIDKKNLYLFEEYTFSKHKQSGYIYNKKENGTIYFHRKVMEGLIKYINEKLQVNLDLVVHHIDGVKLKNYEFNLMVLPECIHKQIHGKKIKRGIKETEVGIEVFINDDPIQFKALLNKEKEREAHLLWAMLEYMIYGNFFNLIYCEYMYQYNADNLSYIIDSLTEKQDIQNDIKCNNRKNNIPNHIYEIFIEFVEGNREEIIKKRKKKQYKLKQSA